ncbi:MAG: T9SS type A sorting domain-containing protein, partial [Sphingobacteriales bacterium]
NSLIDYFVLNSYMVNKDWLNWNTSWWRGLDPSGDALKWRYALWDCDGVLGHYVNYTGIPDITANADPCDAEELEVGEGHAQTIAKLVTESPIVRQRYIARYADLLNTHLSCANVTAIFDSIIAQMTPEMPRQIARWGGSMQQWQDNVQAARDFLLERCSQTINTGMVECYDVTGPFETTFQVEPADSGTIRMNSEWLTSYPFTAQVFGNFETLLTAEAQPGYQFSHWVVDGAEITPDDLSADIVLEVSQATSVTAHFTEITNAEQALYYWHFNTLETPDDVTAIPADYSLIPEAAPLMTYTGSGPRDIDANNSGSILNIHFDELSGRCARVRNPAEGRSLVFDLPTTGYKDIKFAYAVQRTNEGQLANQIAYSIDGVNFIDTGLAQTSFDVGIDFTLVSVDFTSMPAVSGNPNFKIRITFAGNTTSDSGNNRFDNITLKGVAEPLSAPTQNEVSYQVFPNPFKNLLQVNASENIMSVSVFDLVGKRVFSESGLATRAATLDLSRLNTGVYLLKIKTTNSNFTRKIVKQQ